MAFRKVEVSEEERKAMGQSFISLDNIGDRFTGRLVKTQPQTGPYAKPDRVDYVFKYANPPPNAPGHRPELAVKAVAEGILKSYGDVAMKLKKANVRPGWIVRVTKTGDLDIGKDNPMPTFDVEIDDTPPHSAQGQAAAPAPAPKPAPKPPPPPAAEPTDDIPF